MAGAVQAEKARELVEKAEKKLASWSLFGSSSKTEDACESFQKAANLFKVAKQWREAGEVFEKVARCHLKLESAHEAATAYTDAANCYKKTDASKAILLYKEAVNVQQDLGRFTTIAKLQKEIAELHESENDIEAAMEAFQLAADFYYGEDSTSSGNQCLLKVAVHAAAKSDYKRAIAIYEQVAMSSLESTLLKYSVNDYFLRAGLCHLATANVTAARAAVDRYKSLDLNFGSTREGTFLDAITTACEDMDPDSFTDLVREFDTVSRLDAQKTSLLLEIKNGIKSSVDDIT